MLSAKVNTANVTGILSKELSNETVLACSASMFTCQVKLDRLDGGSPTHEPNDCTDIKTEDGDFFNEIKSESNLGSEWPKLDKTLMDTEGDSLMELPPGVEHEEDEISVSAHSTDEIEGCDVIPNVTLKPCKVILSRFTELEDSDRSSTSSVNDSSELDESLTSDPVSQPADPYIASDFCSAHTALLEDPITPSPLYRCSSAVHYTPMQCLEEYVLPDKTFIALCREENWEWKSAHSIQLEILKGVTDQPLIHNGLPIEDDMGIPDCSEAPVSWAGQMNEDNTAKNTAGSSLPEPTANNSTESVASDSSIDSSQAFSASVSRPQEEETTSKVELFTYYTNGQRFAILWYL